MEENPTNAQTKELSVPPASPEVPQPPKPPLEIPERKRRWLIWVLGAVLLASLLAAGFYFWPRSEAYCGQFDYTVSYAWGGTGENAKKCQRAGCVSVKVGVHDDPSASDDEYAIYQCVPRSHPWAGKEGSRKIQEGILTEPEDGKDGRTTARLDKEFTLTHVGDYAALSGTDIRVEAIDVRETCQSPGPGEYITLDFVTSDPSVCDEIYIVRKVFKYAVGTGKEAFDGVGEVIETTDDVVTFRHDGGVYRVIRSEDGSSFRILNMDARCEGSQGDAKRYCLFSVGEELGDPSYCNLIDAPTEYASIAELRNGCIRIIAKKKKDPAMCLPISSTEERDKCLTWLALENPEACADISEEATVCRCNAMEDGPEKVLCLEYVIATDANYINNFYCDKIGTPLQGPCLRIKARRIADCPGIPTYDSEVKCYKKFIDKNRSYPARPQGMDICDEVEDETGRERCKSVVLEEGLDESP